MAKPKSEQEKVDAKDILALLGSLDEDQKAAVAQALGMSSVKEVFDKMDLATKMQAMQEMENDLNKQIQANAMSPESMSLIESFLQGVFNQYVLLQKAEAVIVACLKGLKRYRMQGQRNFHCMKEEAWKNHLYKVQEYFTTNFQTLGKRLKEAIFPNLVIPDVKVDSSLYKVEDITMTPEEYVKIAHLLEDHGGLKVEKK